MSATKVIKYIFLTILTYLLLSAIEIFTLWPFIKGFEFGWVTELVIILVVLLFFNTIITYYLIEKLPFKPEGLKTKDGIKENLKKPVEV